MNEPERARILTVTDGTELLAPEVLPFEVGNALTAMLKRRTLQAEEIHQIWDVVQRIPVELREINFPRALAIASDQNIYAYDAYFLECSERLHCPLLTLDQRLQTVAKSLNIRSVELR